VLISARLTPGPLHRLPEVLRLVILLIAICPVFGEVRQTTFDFHSGFWVNLHHTLYNQAAGLNAGRAPDLSGLDAAETAAWHDAVEYYQLNFAGHDFLEFAMIKISKSLAVSIVPEPVREVLER